MKKSLGLLVLIFAVQANSASARYCYIGSNGEQYCQATSDSSGYNPAPRIPKTVLAVQAAKRRDTPKAQLAAQAAVRPSVSATYILRAIS